MRWTPILSVLVAAGCGAKDDARAPAETGAPQTAGEPPRAEAAMDEVRERRVSVGGAEVQILESGRATDPCVLLLHGAAFRASTWRELGTLRELARAGFHVVAIDLPGYGDSPKSSLAAADFLPELYAALGLERAVIVSPSMSGAFSLPFVAQHPERVAGYVPVAPAAVAEHLAELEGSTVPTLVLWGGADTVFPRSGADELASAFEDAEIVIFEGARHPCYLDDPARFHEQLAGFARRVQKN